MDPARVSVRYDSDPDAGPPPSDAVATPDADAPAPASAGARHAHLATADREHGGVDDIEDEREEQRHAAQREQVDGQARHQATAAPPGGGPTVRRTSADVLAAPSTKRVPQAVQVWIDASRTVSSTGQRTERSAPSTVQRTAEGGNSSRCSPQ